MELKREDGAARAACSPKREHLPFIENRFLIYLHVSPQEAEERFVFFQQTDLMEHPFHITTDGDWVFPEPKKDSQQTGSQVWAPAGGGHSGSDPRM